MADRIGTTEADRLEGTAGADLFQGLEADDILIGLGGADTFDGGAGNDVVVLARSDVDAGAVRRLTPDGVEMIILDSSGAIAARVLFRDVEGVRIDSESGQTLGAVEFGLAGGVQTAPLVRDAESGLYVGSPFDDDLRGVSGLANLFFGYAGDDTFRAAGANDIVAYFADEIAGGVQGVVVDLAGGWAVDGFGDVDRLEGVRNVIGTNRIYSGTISDFLLGSGADNFLSGLDGDDYLFGFAGADVLIGGRGADYLDGDAGDDMIVGATTVGEDRVATPETAETDATLLDIVVAGAGNDDVFGFSARLYVEGGAGDDTLVGSSASLPAGQVVSYLFGEDGGDLLLGGAGADALIGSSYAPGGASTQVDTLYGYGGDDYVLQGLHGRGDLHGGAGKDTVVGADGVDTLTGGAGDDVLFGLGGADVFRFVLAPPATGATGLEDVSPGAFDTIVDFAPGADRLEIVGVDRGAIAFSSYDGGALIVATLSGGVQYLALPGVSAADAEAATTFL